MLRSFTITLVFLTIGAEIFSQDIWLRPAKYFYEPGDTALIQFATGEDFIARPLLPSASEIESLEFRNKVRFEDLRPHVGNDERTPVVIPALQEGYQFIFFKTNRTLKFDGAEFNEFLKQYGADQIYAERQKGNRASQSAKILAANTVQLAFRVGRSEGQGWNPVQGLPIEVIPDKNPQTLKRGDRIQFTVYENGTPAFGVRVKIWNRWDKRTTIQNIYTEKDGTVTTTISNPGDWMVTVAKIHSTEKPDEYAADVFTLNFGYR